MGVRPAKIVFVTSDLFIGGGAEGMLVRVVTAKPSLADEMIVVSLLPGDSHLERLRAAGITVVQLDFGRPLGIAAGVCRLIKLIADARPQIVQGWMYHGDLAALIAVLFAGRRRRTRLIWSIRCSNMDLRSYGIGLRLAVRVCAVLSRLPDVVTANSAAGLKTHLHLGYRPRRVEVIANGIDVDRFKPDLAARAAVRAELGIAQSEFLVAHVARVDPMKDHQTLAAALRELPQVKALLIGAGTESLPRMSNALALGRRDNVERLLAAADIIMSSSAFGEGFSNALAEGMACGLPAVATDVGDARVIVGDSGIVVPARNAPALAAAIRMLAQEPAPTRAARGARARTHIVENFSMRRALTHFGALYESLDGKLDRTSPERDPEGQRTTD
jgi:glycosyltransferase involved in cell wall biosynthesis